MTEREKMIEILKQTSDLWKEEESHGYIVSVDLGKIADALIEAGIGDVSKWQAYCDLYSNQAGDIMEDRRKAREAADYSMQGWKRASAKCEELEHRAEVAERALLNMTKKYNSAERKIATTKDGWFSLGEAQIALLANGAIKEAEKELAEEG